MEQVVRVQRCDTKGNAQVLHIRQSACSGDCHQCSGCGAAQEALLFTALNPIGAQPGDMVIVRSKTGPVLAAATIMYILPLVLFFLGYVLFAVAWDKGALGGCVAFAVGIALAAVYDRTVARKQKTVYTIIGYAGDLSGNP